MSESGSDHSSDDTERLLSPPIIGAQPVRISNPILCDSVEYHFAVCGKSGTGKSSLCNQLSQKVLHGVTPRFRVGQGLTTVTVHCQQEPAVSPDNLKIRVHPLVLQTNDPITAQPATNDNVTRPRTETEDDKKHAQDLTTVTAQCQQEMAVSQNELLLFSVIDVPGESSETFPLKMFVEAFQQHIRDSKERDGKQCKTIIIICVRHDAQYAIEEHRTYLELKRMWGDNQDFCKRLVVAFTHGDKLHVDTIDDESGAESLDQSGRSAAGGAGEIRDVGEERGKTDKARDQPGGKELPRMIQRKAKMGESERDPALAAEQHHYGTLSSSAAQVSKGAEQASGTLQVDTAQKKTSEQASEMLQMDSAQTKASDQASGTQQLNTAQQMASVQIEDAGKQSSPATQPEPTDSHAQAGDKKDALEEAVRQSKAMDTAAAQGQTETGRGNTIGDGVGQESLQPGTSETDVLTTESSEGTSKETVTVHAKADERGAESSDRDAKSGGRGAENIAGTPEVTEEGSANSADVDIETPTREEKILAKTLPDTWPQLKQLLEDAGNRYVLFIRAATRMRELS